MKCVSVALSRACRTYLSIEPSEKLKVGGMCSELCDIVHCLYDLDSYVSSSSCRRESDESYTEQGSRLIKLGQVNENVEGRATITA